MIVKRDNVREVLGVVQQYDWGMIGRDSLVAQLSSANSGETIRDGEPYAELWMGTHPSAPSKIKNSNALLKDCLSADLPFLFKVLSVGKALSIQVNFH